MKTYTTIRDLANALSHSLDLDLDETRAAVDTHRNLISAFGEIPHREIAALSRAVFETVTGVEYCEDWAIGDRELIADEDDDERADAAAE